MENARKFLARAVPWPTAHDNWWISIHWGWERNGKKGISFGQAFKDLNAAARWIEYIRDQPGTDLYVCMSGIGVVEQKTTKKGRPFHVAQRLAQNAMAIRSWWLDVDVITNIKKKGFRSTAAALDAVMLFCQQNNMPPPTFLVMSGSGGFHVHWVSEDPVSIAEWQPIARALVAATQHFILTPLDTAVVSNPVCLLRIPDTFNWKTDPRKPVTLAGAGRLVSIERMRTALARFIGASTKINETIIRPGQSILGTNFPQKTPIPFEMREKYPELGFQGTIDDVAVTCPFIAETLRIRGEGIKEPVWWESLKVAYYTSDPLDAAQRLSEGDDRYTKEEIEERLAIIKKDRQRRDLGWPQCATIHATGAEQCGTCPHLAKGQSPFNFVRPPADLQPSLVTPSNGNAAATPPPTPSTWYLPLPFGYRETPDHIVLKVGVVDPEKPNEPPVDKPVCGIPVWQFWQQAPREGQRGYYALNFTAGLNVDKEIQLPFTCTSDQRAMFARLNDQGFHVAPKYHKLWSEFVSAFIEKLRANAGSIVACEQLGWSNDAAGKRSAFVYGNTRFNCAGNTPVAHADPRARDDYTQVGTLEAWKEAAKLVTDQRIPALDTIIAASFGAPLVAPCGYSGMTLSAYSLESGASKTAAVRVGQSAWGNPDKSPALNDTANSANERLGFLRHLPLFYDDVRMQQQMREFVDLMFAIGQGKTKMRLKRDGTPGPVVTFATLTVLTSNPGILDYVVKQTTMTPAGIMRLFEFEVPLNVDKVGLINGARAQQMIYDLNANYGHAGLAYAQFLGQNVERIEKEVSALNRHLVERLKVQQEERYWVGTLAVLIMGARYANALGLTEIDEAALVKFLVAQYRLQRQQRLTSSTDVTKQTTLVEYLRQYINDRRQQTVVTDHVWTMSYRPPKTFTIGKSHYDLTKIQGRVAVRVALKDRILLISRSDLSDWLEKPQRQLQARAFIDRMKREFQLPEIDLTGKIANHTQHGGTRERIFQFSLEKYPDLYDID